AGRLRARFTSASMRWRFSILYPKASSPISSAENLTSGARHRRPVSSTIRMVRSVAAWSAHIDQTPSESSAATEPASRAVVRLSAFAGRSPPTTVSTPPSAKEIAAVRPAGPPPTTMAAGLSARLCGIQGLARFDIKRSSTVRQGPETTPLCCDFAWSRNALCQGEMTETTSYQFTHLAPAEAGLGRIFARPKAIAAGCVIVIAGLGWLYLALLISAPAGSWFAMMQALCRALPDGAWNVPAAAVTASMWGAMTLAMMLPSASPLILTYAEIAET